MGQNMSEVGGGGRGQELGKLGCGGVIILQE